MMSVKTISTIQKVGVSLSLGGSLSLPLAIVVAMMSVKTVVSSVSQSIVSTTIQKVGVSLSLRGSLSLPLAVVHTVAKTVVAKTIAVSPQSTIHKVGISLSLGGSLSLTLAIVAKTVSTVVSSKTVSVSQSVSSVAVEVRISSSLCLGFRLSGSDGRKSENYEQFHVECRMSRSQLSIRIP